MASPHSSSKARSKSGGSTRGAKGAETKIESLLPIAPVLWAHHRLQLEPLIAEWRTQERVPPVLLITAPAGTGKRELVYHLAQTLLCERTGFGGGKDEAPAQDEGPGLFGDLDGPGLFGDAGSDAADAPPAAAVGAAPMNAPCGECTACQKALHGTWVDFTEIAPETDGDDDADKGTLKIEQFRRLKATQGFGAFDGGYRITLIRDADRMTAQAANSLLKLLEEPPPGWLVFLTASEPSLLIPTLLSRCQKLRLRPLPAEAVQSMLEAEGVPAARARAAAELSQGSFKRAQTLSHEESWEKRDQVLRFLDRPADEITGLVDWAAQGEKTMEQLLDLLESSLVQLVEDSLSGEAGPSADPSKSLARHRERLNGWTGNPGLSRRFWTERLERIFRMRQELRAPLNKKLLAQDLLAPWLEISQGNSAR